MALISTTNAYLDTLSATLTLRAINDLAIANATDPSTLPGYHDNRGPALEVTVWVLTAVAWVFLGLRIYCKWLMRRGLYWDDWTLLGAGLILFLTVVMESVSIHNGFGRHKFAIDLANVSKVSLFSQLGATFYVTSQGWSKTSFALTLHRIAEPWMQKLIWFIIATINLLSFLACLFFWVQCRPVSKSWDPLAEGTCWDPQVNVKLGIVATVWSGIWDIALALLPWKILLGLQMDLRKKIGIALAMSMGIFAGACVFVKAFFLHLQAESDFTYEGSALITWGVVEASVTIMATSIPVMRVLLREAMSSRNYRSGIGTNGHGNSYGSGSGSGTNPNNNNSKNSIGVQMHISISKSGAVNPSSKSSRRGSFSTTLSSKTRTAKGEIEIYAMTNISERSLTKSVSDMPLRAPYHQASHDMM